MIKLVAIDLDGTLLQEQLTVSKKNLEQIKKVKAQGIKVIIATGRPAMLARPYAKMIGTEVPFIFYNGGQIRDLNTEEVLYNKTLDKAYIRKVIELTQEENSAYMLYGKDTIYYIPNKRIFEIREKSKDIFKDSSTQFVEIKDYEEILALEEFNKIIIVEYDQDKNKKIHKRVSDLKMNVDLIRSASYFIEVLPKGVSKGKALEYLAESLNIKQEEVMAIGDQENDIEMLKYAHIGVAMGNATKEVQGHSDYVTYTNELDGVAHALEKFLISE